MSLSVVDRNGVSHECVAEAFDTKWQMNRLKAESERTGAPVAELVRRAIDKMFPAKKRSS